MALFRTSRLTLIAPRISACLALAGALGASFEAHAVSLRVVAGAGYENMQVEKDDDNDKTPKPATGYTLEALGEVGFLDTVPGFSLLAGGGLRTSSLTVKEDDIRGTLNPTMLAAEFGAEFSLIPLLRVQAIAGYDLGIAGGAKVEGKIQNAVTGNSVTISETYDFDTFGRFGLTGRLLFSVAPFLSVGLEPTWYTGNYKLESKNGFKPDEAKYTGYAAKAVVAFTL